MKYKYPVILKQYCTEYMFVMYFFYKWPVIFRCLYILFFISFSFIKTLFMSQSPADTIAEMCYLNTGFILILNIICITCLLNISVTVII